MCSGGKKVQRKKSPTIIYSSYVRGLHDFGGAIGGGGGCGGNKVVMVVAVGEHHSLDFFSVGLFSVGLFCRWTFFPLDFFSVGLFFR